MSEFVFVQGLKGPEGQLWHEPQVTGNGTPRREVLFSQSVSGKTLDQCIYMYKENVLGYENSQ